MHKILFITFNKKVKLFLYSINKFSFGLTTLITRFLFHLSKVAKN